MIEQRPPATGTVISFAGSAKQLQDTPARQIDADTAAAVGLEVAKASAHFRTDLRPAQADLLTADFIEDLGHYRIQDIQAGFAAYRRNPDSRFFPRPGQIIAEVETILSERRATARAERRSSKALPDSRPLMWWLLPKSLWKSHWREDEIPKDAA